MWEEIVPLPSADSPAAKAGVMPKLGYRYALSFLDSTPKPSSGADTARLLRLMAYDMVLGCGHRGSDPAGVLAAALRGLYALRGNEDPQWSWEFDGLVFEATKAPSLACREGAEEVHFPGNPAVFLCASQWLDLLREVPLPDPHGDLDQDKPRNYPPPEHSIQIACLLAIEVAGRLCGARAASATWEAPSGQCVEISVDLSKFLAEENRLRHARLTACV